MQPQHGVAFPQAVHGAPAAGNPVSAHLPGSPLDRANVVVACVVVTGGRPFAIPKLHLVVRSTGELCRFEMCSCHALDREQRNASTPVCGVSRLIGLAVISPRFVFVPGPYLVADLDGRSCSVPA